MSHKISKENLQALAEGEHEAFDKIFIAYYPKVKYFIASIIRSDDDAEELAQDIFVKLWVNHSSVDPEKSFNSFLYTSARNAAYNYLKHKLVEQSYLKDLPREENFASSSEQIIFAKETELLINLTVSGMPEQRKKIYLLSRDKGKSNSEIAEDLNISKKTVENQLSLALKEIRQVVSMFLMFFC